MSKFTVYTDKHNEFRWKFVASNNTVIAKSGESFKKQEDCLTSLHLLQKDITGAATDFQLRNGVHPVTTVASSAAPGVLLSPAIAPSPAIVAAPAIQASPAISPAPSVTPQN